jgi:excinuclease ABC subunit A
VSKIKGPAGAADSRREIVIRGAREHNLKNLDIVLPRDRMIVVTGLSGSGKSSLAFDTIFAEGQRRYVESLSAYARQFLEQMQKPAVESIEGLPPTIAIEQRGGSASPRSTVATTTEIYDFLRLLYARCGTPYCYKCGKLISQQSAQQIVQGVLKDAASVRERIMVLAPMVRGRKGEHVDVFRRARSEGYVRVRVNGIVTDLADVAKLAKNRKHDIDIVVDRLALQRGVESRLTDSVETALKLGEGMLVVSRETPKGWKDALYSERYACPICGISYEELAPNMFSFNSPYGACTTCDGLGTRLEFDPDLVAPDKELTLREGAVDVWRRGGKRMAIYYHYVLQEFCRDFKVDPDVPFRELPKEIQEVLIRGTESRPSENWPVEFEGVIPNCVRRFHKTTSEYVKSRLHDYMSELPCPTCKGARLRKESLAVRVAEKAIHEVTRMSITEASDFFRGMTLEGEKERIAEPILKEIRQRLSFMVDVGIGYLTLNRMSSTLAGGEAQRIRLATQVGSGLVGVCYVLDEPTIGLHQRDNERLLKTLLRLRDLGNTVIVVEHDEAAIRCADHIVDLGPGAGAHGGEIVAQGGFDEILVAPRSLTGAYLSGKLGIPVPERRRRPDPDETIQVRGARENNLKNLKVDFPLGCFVAVTGVSGSGKSTLVTQILYRALARKFYRSREHPGRHDRIVGTQKIDKVIEIDQSPIGRTPRSNPATYTKLFDQVRRVFAMTKEAKVRGYGPGRFSFNVKGGRCEACQGQGTKMIEMHFLPDVFVQCEECRGRRYNSETLDVRFKGLNIAEVLDLRVDEAREVFAGFPVIKRFLQTLTDVGLGYIALGQSSKTLSGGEAQRIKLAAELGRRSTGRTLYILDEPTTGLHFADINRLLDVLNRLVDMGNTVIVIEHNLDVIKTADHIIDLGPEGGDEGGRIVATGSPEKVAANDKSYTGQFLRELFKREASRAAAE